MLTKKQIELLEFIQKCMAKNGVPPSFDEMKAALDLKSKSGIHRLVTALEERGFIRRLPHRARALEIVRLPDALTRPDSRLASSVVSNTREISAPQYSTRHSASAEMTELPVMGRIAAGVPIEAISEISHHIIVPDSMISAQANHYALEVRGDSMINAGIMDGDIVVIREQETADNDNIIVALVDGHEATLKFYRRKGAMVVLEAANPAYEPRILPEDQIRVQGRLVGLIRNY